MRMRRSTRTRWALLLGALCVAGAGRAQESAPPATSARPLRDEQGLEARRRRYAEHPAKSVAMLPVRLLELPFDILNYPIEHWVAKKPTDPLLARISRGLAAAEAQGVTVEARLETGHSGLGGGIGYRLPRTLTGPVNLRFFGGATHRGYQLYYVQLDTLRLGPSDFWLRGQYLDLAQESFFGLGIDSQLGSRSNYELGVTTATLAGQIGRGPRVQMTFDVGFSRTDVRPGENDDFPPTQSVFSDIEGLSGRFDFVEGGAALVWDRRDNEKYARRGSYARASVHLAGGVNGTENAFAKYGLELRQYLPLPGARRVLGLRLAGTITDNFDETDIPFFRLERLGGSRTLRGVQTYRFTDKDMLTAGVEYRFPFWNLGLESQTAIDALGFFDMGTVLPNLEEVQWHDIQPTGGFGFRIVSKNTVFVRTDFAWSEEDSRVHIGFGSLH